MGRQVERRRDIIVSISYAGPTSNVTSQGMFNKQGRFYFYVDKTTTFDSDVVKTYLSTPDLKGLALYVKEELDLHHSSITLSFCKVYRDILAGVGVGG